VPAAVAPVDEPGELGEEADALAELPVAEALAEAPLVAFVRMNDAPELEVAVDAPGTAPVVPVAPL
jgi:hypothetical protein